MSRTRIFGIFEASGAEREGTGKSDLKDTWVSLPLLVQVAPRPNDAAAVCLYVFFVLHASSVFSYCCLYRRSS